jgi:NAD-dependent deacetylase
VSEQSLQALVDNSRRIVFFGGAGVSTESGIPDFRSAGGLYGMKHKYPPEEILSHSFLAAHTEEFFDFYRSSILYPDARPNKAHIKLAEMEKAGRLTAVVTQNIDGLHQMAGSQNVLELHGSVHRNYCVKCRAAYDMEFILNSTGVPRCQCGGLVRPDVVLYEEPLDNGVMQQALEAISAADLVIVGGTSLVVYPAAGLLSHYNGALVLINRTATPYDGQARLVIREPIGETLGALTV